MNSSPRFAFVLSAVTALVATSPAFAQAAYQFSTGFATNLIGTASRPDLGGKLEIESADDFVTTATSTRLTSASFTGLITTVGGGLLPAVQDVVIEIYRVFPNDSDLTRLPKVPTRVNSPSDVEFAGRDSAAGDLAFSVTVLTSSFTALNSVRTGINPFPNQTTLGEGPVTGAEVQFGVNFTTPIDLPAGHYFFVPQVAVAGTNDFYWLSGERPITPPGTPFTPDLQSWIRNENLAPDWLRIGTDIISGTTFNGAFTLDGIENPTSITAVPEPATLGLFASAGLAALCVFRRRAQSHKK